MNPEESTVITITGNGLKTIGAVTGWLEEEEAIRPKLVEFEERYMDLEPTAAA